MSDEHDGLVHRDDLPPELIEELERQFPGMQIVCAGDSRGDPLPADVQESFDRIERLHEESIVHGLCVDCGASIPGYSPDSFEDWQLPAGWRVFSNISNGEPMCFQCPQCDSEDRDETGH